MGLCIAMSIPACPASPPQVCYIPTPLLIDEFSHLMVAFLSPKLLHSGGENITSEAPPAAAPY